MKSEYFLDNMWQKCIHNSKQVRQRYSSQGKIHTRNFRTDITLVFSPMKGNYVIGGMMYTGKEKVNCMSVRSIYLIYQQCVNILDNYSIVKVIAKWKIPICTAHIVDNRNKIENCTTRMGISKYCQYHIVVLVFLLFYGWKISMSLWYI